MTPEQKEQLENEVVKGRNSETMYENYVKEFCQLKREALFMAFSELPLSAEEQLMEVKRMLYAIDTLESEIVSEIKTGEMARQALSEGPGVH
jgi:hypothetical protein